jgi:single-stranded-DNA-specific exonuclease
MTHHDVNLIRGNKYLWYVPIVREGAAPLSASYNMSVPLMHTLLRRGYDTREKIDAFLFSSKERDVAPEILLKDAEKAVDRIILAIERNEKILIAGDYDVDGMTSTSMMMMCLLRVGACVNYFLPHRVRDGYGLSTKMVDRAAANKYTLIITVDNGITACEPVQRAREHGIDVIITDHHRPQDILPHAYAIVDPAQETCQYPFKSLAGVGVTFKLLSLLYAKLGQQLPHKVYELLLLGTIADVVPLLGENRHWVRHGLAYIKDHASYAFNVLAKNGRLAERVISAQDIAFSVAPQLNALGRLEDPRRGVQFLIGARRTDIDRVGSVLHELNEARKTIERSIVAEIEGAIAQKKIDIEREALIVAASSKWPPGVIGLVASRLTSEYGRPSLLFHLTKQGVARGSGRSIPEFNLFDALKTHEHLLDHFGGHSCAVGVSLSAERIATLKECLEATFHEQLAGVDLSQKIVLDAPIDLSEVTAKFVDDMRLLEPFGHMNSVPIFYIRQARLVGEPVLLKDQHVKCRICADGVVKPVIFFGRQDIYRFLCEHAEDAFDVAAEVVENVWQGTRTIELRGIDIAPSICDGLH